MKHYSILLFGSSGKMGKELQILIKKHSFFSLYENTDSDLKKINPSKIDLVIDFSHQKSFFKIANWAKENKKSFLSGTTGLTSDDFDLLKKMSFDVAVFWSANMSPGIYLMGLCLDLISKKTKNFNYKISETHHTEKKDSPSGTALNLLKILNKNNIEAKIQSTRQGTEAGLHTINLSSPSEDLIFSHIAHNRCLFAKGAIKASEFIIEKKNGFYTMSDLL